MPTFNQLVRKRKTDCREKNPQHQHFRKVITPFTKSRQISQLHRNEEFVQQ